jgi:arylsulfatase A-like enzyme
MELKRIAENNEKSKTSGKRILIMKDLIRDFNVIWEKFMNARLNIPLSIAIMLIFSYAIEGTTNLTLVHAGTKKPNIVIILADDLGWNDVGFHGSEIKTPNLDKLAESGVRLENFYVKASCTPTRAALMTGRHPFRFGMSSNGIRIWDKVGLPIKEKTIAQILKKAGYYTAIIGKWHLGHYKESYLPTHRGFDFHYGHYAGHIDYFSHKVGKVCLDWHRNKTPVEESGYTTDLIGKEAVNLINKHSFDRAPLFLYIAFNAPHAPLQAKEEDINNYLEIEDEGRRVFAAQVQSMDKAIGSIIRALKESQVYENTFLFFTSDNGGSTDRPWARGDNRPLRGQKGTLYEGGVRVPTLLTYPAKLKAGQENYQIFSIVDLLPTLSNLAGANLDIQNISLDGVDILQSLASGFTGRDILLIQYIVPSKSWINKIPRAAIIKGSYKLILNGQFSPYHGIVELFNIKYDPLETHNLAHIESSKVREIQNVLFDYVGKVTPNILNSFNKKPKNFTYPKILSPEYLQEKSKDKESF